MKKVYFLCKTMRIRAKWLVCCNFHGNPCAIVHPLASGPKGYAQFPGRKLNRFYKYDFDSYPFLYF